jgi:hypothetical protein
VPLFNSGKNFGCLTSLIAHLHLDGVFYMTQLGHVVRHTGRILNFPLPHSVLSAVLLKNLLHFVVGCPHKWLYWQLFFSRVLSSFSQWTCDYLWLCFITFQNSHKNPLQHDQLQYIGHGFYALWKHH